MYLKIKEEIKVTRKKVIARLIIDTNSAKTGNVAIAVTWFISY